MICIFLELLRQDPHFGVKKASTRKTKTLNVVVRQTEFFLVNLVT